VLFRDKKLDDEFKREFEVWLKKLKWKLFNLRDFISLDRKLKIQVTWKPTTPCWNAIWLSLNTKRIRVISWSNN
jgi:hypothetical protein